MIAEAERSGHSEDVCTYVKADIGMMAKGNIAPNGKPFPTRTFSSSATRGASPS